MEITPISFEARVFVRGQLGRVEEFGKLPHFSRTVSSHQLSLGSGPDPSTIHIARGRSERSYWHYVAGEKYRPSRDVISGHLKSVVLAERALQLLVASSEFD
ncbi:MAG: hypothetical protein WAJ91_03445, partial [Rhodoplanes sp.]